MLEIGANAGLVVITTPREIYGNLDKLTITTAAGNARLVSLKAHELNSIWPLGPSPAPQQD